MTIAPVREGGYSLRDLNTVILEKAPTIDVINRLLAELNQSAISGLQLFAVHAGVIGANGSLLAFPAASGAGKSTLVAACLRHGFDYWSDEALIISNDGLVLPYRRPISLSAASRQLLRLSRVSKENEIPLAPSDLGIVSTDVLGHLRHILALSRRSGPPLLTPLPRSGVIRALLGHSFNHFRNPEESFQIAVRLAETCTFWDFAYDDPLEGAIYLRQHFMSA